MKMSETSWGFGGVWGCCINALLEITPWYSVIPGDTVICPSCKEVWTLGNDRVWRTAIQRGER